MAGSIIAVVEKLTNLLAEESNLLKGVKGKVETLMGQLSLMEGVMKDADSKHGGNEAYNRWLHQIRDLGYHAVDVIETYRNDSESAGFWSIKLIRDHHLNGKIDKILASLEGLLKSKQGFSITPNTNPEVDAASEAMLRLWREPPAIMKEDEYIDLAEDAKVLTAQLSSMEWRHGVSVTVVSIVGMGGLGKTTLANKLYNTTNFECKAFITVSKKYRRRDILYQILEGVTARSIVQSEKEEEKDLIVKLHNFLQDRRYLVVLDDIWEKEDWDHLKEAFPSGTMGGKVMLTTRNREVAKHAGSFDPHEPRLLTVDESLQLLRKKALPRNADFTTELKILGRQMVEKCGGLPLAVVVLGGLLSGKDLEQWENVSGNSRWRIMNDEDRLSTVLALSYNYLPFHLKLCFQHLGIFPEDFCIPKNELIQLWAAERFLPQQGLDTEEGVAEKCMYELVNRSMVLVGARTCRGRVKSIRIHDILREFSISKATEGNFLRIYSRKEVGSTSSCSSRFQRLGIHGTYEDYAFLKPHIHHLRSIHFFSPVGGKIDFIYKNSKLLHVLDVECTESHGKREFDALQNMTQLRYLRLWGRSQMVSLPSSIARLTNLETLNLRGCVFGQSVADVIWKMKRLRHLYLNTSISYGSVKLKPDSSIHLRTLKGISSGSWVKHGLVKMIYMRKLDICLRSREHANLSFNAITKLQHLQSLSLRGWYFPQGNQLAGCVRLQKLYISGIHKLPGASEFPPNLVKLCLTYCGLQQDSISTLEALPKLKMLSLLLQSYEPSELVCSAKGFPQLEVFQLKSLYDLQKWTVEEGAMMNIKHVKIQDCYNLNQVSEGFKTLTTLEELDISGCPDFEDMLQTNQDLVEFTEKHSIKFVRR